MGTIPSVFARKRNGLGVGIDEIDGGINLDRHGYPYYRWSTFDLHGLGFRRHHLYSGC